MSSTWTVRGKTCLITGATSGIGRETALGLAREGAALALHGRDPSRLARSRDDARAAGSPRVDVFTANLTEQREVRRLAAEVRDRVSAVDVFISNAGVVMRERRLTSDGVEATLAVNHLAPFLLVDLLLDRIQPPADRSSRIVVVASQVEARGVIDFDDLMMEKAFTSLGAYDRSKLANVLFSYELARRLHEARVTVNCLHPGVIATNLLSDYEGRSRLLGMALRLTNEGPKKGAQASIRLAVDPALEYVSGRYFRPNGEARSSPASYDRALAKRLWEVSARLVGLRDAAGPTSSLEER